MSQLQNQDQFPSITASTLEGDEKTIPSDLGSEWVTLLFYRGEW